MSTDEHLNFRLVSPEERWIRLMSKLMTACVDEHTAINLRAKGVLNHGPEIY